MQISKVITITLLYLASSSLSFSQDIKILEPQLGRKLDFSKEFIEKFNSAEAFADCEKVAEQLREENRSWKDVTEEEKEILKYCDEVRVNVYDIVGGACSWYCGGGQDSLSASSTLISQGQNNYVANNAHDLDYSTAWVEGVEGYGIGEYLEYHTQPTNPRITQIRIVNGYAKSKKAWKDNSRVRSIKMYIDDNPYAVLHLKDIRDEQVFDVEPIGYDERIDLESKPVFIMKFEIIDIYPGERYEDSAITEIYFDGIDVH